MDRNQDTSGLDRTGYSAGPRNSLNSSGGNGIPSDSAMTTSISARRLITADGAVEYPQINIHDDGTIASIEAGEPGLEETTLTAAFFDIHVHGAAGHDAMEGTSKALGGIGTFLATKGVAHYLATTVTAPVEKTLRALEGIAGAIDGAEKVDEAHGARPVGIHLE